MKTSSLEALLEKRSWAAGLFAAAMAAVLLVLMARHFLGHMPLYDELLHFLAARGWQEQGGPVIADGAYARARLFTWMIAVAIGSLGDTLVAARIPSLIAAAGLVALTAMWVTRRAGLLAGVTAAVVLCMVPATVDLAVFIRFYTVHALLILAMAIAAYEASVPGRTLRGRIALGIVAVVFLLPAVHLQVTTLIACGAVVAGIACVLLMDHWSTAWPFIRRYPIRIAIAGRVLLILGMLVLAALGFIDALRAAPVWASGAASKPLYYLVKLADDMSLLWPLFPAAAIIAFNFHRRLTLFCTVLLLAALAVHSLAGAKSVRYVYYALPFFGIVWGCALAGAVAWIGQLRETRTGSQEPRSTSGQSPAPEGRFAGGGRMPALAVVAVAAVVLVLSQEGQRAAKLVVGKGTVQDALGYAGEADWTSAVATLEPMASGADRLVTSNAMKALYYLDRYDYELNVSIVAETDTGEEFGLDGRTGRKAIGTSASTAQVLDMPGSTLVILEVEKINNRFGVTPDAMDVITDRCTTVVVPIEAGIRAWMCSGGGAQPSEPGEIPGV